MLNMDPFFSCLRKENRYWFHFLRIDPFLLWLRFYPRPKQNGKPLNPFIEAYLFNIQNGKNYYIKEDCDQGAVEKVRDGVKWGNNGVLYRSGMMGAIAHLSWDFDFLSELKNQFFLRSEWWARLFGFTQCWIFVSGNPYNGSITFRDQNYFVQQDTRSLAGICHPNGKVFPQWCGFFISPSENIRLEFIAYVERGQKRVAYDLFRKPKDQIVESARSSCCPVSAWNKNGIEFNLATTGFKINVHFKIRDDYWVKAEGDEESPRHYCFFPFVEIHLQNSQTLETTTVHNSESDLAFLELDGVAL